MAINSNNFEPVVVNVNSNSTTINLSDVFDDSLTTGKVATFNFYEDSFSDDINVLLFDQNGDGAPITVENFLNYVTDGDYVNSIIHRSASLADGTPFVIQGGGFVIDNFFENSTVGTVPTDDPIVNEFSPNRSNTRGTIATAKLGGNPDSATSQWFFNLSDNSANLDNQNGGFTVFGEVLSQADLDAIDAIASIPVFNGSNLNSAFTDLPLDINPDDLSEFDQDNDFIRLENITVQDVPELSFTIEENTNPDVVKASIDRGGNIELDYADVLDSPLYRFQNSELLGTYLFVTEGERQSVIDNFPIFQEEGLAFNITSSPEGDIVTGDAEITVKATNLLGDSVTDTLQVSVTEEGLEDIEPIVDELTAFNRFRNLNVAGTYLYATEEESRSIRQNFADVFVEEGLAFYAFGADANQGEDVFRFRNLNVPGTYVFVTAEEARSIRQNFSDVFVEEGVAFEVL